MERARLRYPPEQVVGSTSRTGHELPPDGPVLLKTLDFVTIKNSRASFGLIIHHTDAEREYAHDANPRSSGKLIEALQDAPQRGWIVVDEAGLEPDIRELAATVHRACGQVFVNRQFAGSHKSNRHPIGAPA